MRVLVCGGRDYADRELVRIVLDALHKETPITAIIHGAAPGADTLAGWWATIAGVSNQDYPAEWEKHGRRAGPLRNQRMLDEGKPDMVIAFPGGRGTADMVNRARRAGLVVEHAARDAKDARAALIAEANGVIEAERNRIDHFRTRTRDLEAAIAQLFVVLPEHRELIQQTVRDCDTRSAR